MLKRQANSGRVIAMSEVKASRVLTRETVMWGNPCDEYRERFNERFPESVEVTVKLAVSQAEDWDWYWAAQKLLTQKGYNTFCNNTRVVGQEYDATVQPYQDLMNAAYRKADDVYRQAVDDGPAQGLYYNVRYDRANKLYNEVVAVPSAAFAAARKVAQKRLNEAHAKAWAEIFITETDEQLKASPADDGCTCDGCREDRANNDW
jgi:hypothetical protein